MTIDPLRTKYVLGVVRCLQLLGQSAVWLSIVCNAGCHE